MREAGGGRREERLIGFLQTRRWFGEKGREIVDARVRDAVPVEWPNSTKRFAVARVDVSTEQGVSTYQLFAPTADGRAPRADIDALEDPEFLRGLADAWMNGAEFEGDGVRWIVEGEGATPLVVPPNAKISRTSAEQSNSSVILNRQAILKLYRRLEPGVHPDVEVTRFLTLARKFVNVPALLGTVRFEDSAGATIAGMLQEYVHGATDGWTYALDRLRADPTGEALTGEKTPFALDLGRTIRALHESLASGDPGSDFDLQPATVEDVGRWERSARQTMMAGWPALERALGSGALPEASRVAASEVLDQRDEIIGQFDRLADGLADDAGGNTRTHGDLHLGQVLRSATGRFLVIDFEGEPTRPLRERRARSSPLRDVAGMLRSFAYAAAVGSGESNAADEWEATVGAAFYSGYFIDAKLRYGHPGLHPRSSHQGDRLVQLFTAEKAFYELQYELAHRPDWVWIPLRGIRHLFL